MIPRLFLTAFLLLPLFANSAESEQKSHCLWRLKGESNTIYLLGSIHVLRKSDYPLPDKMNAAFADADVLVLEIDIAQAGNAAAMRSMMLPAGKTLKDVLSKKTYRMLAKRFREAKLPLQGVEKFKAWIAVETLMMTELMKLGYKPTHGLDLHFFQRAKKAGMETGSLETVEVQMALMEKLGSDKLVRQALRELDIMESELEAMIRAWKAGDLEALAQSIGEMKDDADIYDAVFSKRNEAWVKQIIPMMKQQQDYLIVVGAGHLVGEGNVIELLEAAGHSLERL